MSLLPKDVQLIAERHVPDSIVDAPSSWGRLGHSVRQAIHAGPDTAWLLGISALTCCSLSSNLTSCSSVRVGVHNASVIASSAAAWSEISGVLASPNGLEFAKCNSCQCEWRKSTAAFGVVHDLKLSASGYAYIAADTGLYTGSMGGKVALVSGLPRGVPFYAVAALPPPPHEAATHTCLGTATSDAIWMRRGGSSSACDGPWRHEWTRGFLGAGATPYTGAAPTSLALSRSAAGSGSHQSFSTVLWVGEAAALHAIDGQTGAITRVHGREGLPANRILALSDSGDGLLWAATRSGVVLRISAGGAADWRFLGGSRWLGTLAPRESVLSVDSVAASALLTTSEGAVTRVTLDPNATLHAKALRMHSEWSRHMSNGLNAMVTLTKFGEPSTAVAYPDDNHGLWTGWRLVANSLRYNAIAAATANGSATTEAVAADLSATLAALRRLNLVTGVPGLPARSLAHPGQPLTPPGRKVSHWGWNDSPTLPGWRFIGNTSSDEITGHVAGYTLALLLARRALSSEEAQLCAALLSNITLRIVRDGFRLLDVDGVTPTRWGNWAPASLNADPLWAEERGLNSVQILSHLICAHRVTGHAELEAAFWTLVTTHGYASNAVNQKISAPDDLSGGDNVLAFVPYLAMHYACTLPGVANATAAMCDAIAPEMSASIRRAYAIVQPAKAALFSFVYAIVEKADAPRAEEAAAIGRHALARYPQELIDWPTDNTHRLDLPTNTDLLPSLNESARALSRDESDAMRWDKRPFSREVAGSGLSSEDPVHFLLSYWMAYREGLVPRH